MAFRLNDAEAEQFVLSRGLATPEQLAPFRVQCSVDSCSLFDLLVAEKFITPELLQELEKNAPPPPPPRSIRSGGGTGFLQPRQSVASAPAVSSGDAGAGGGSSFGISNVAINAANSGANPGVGGPRRPSRTRMFEDGPGASSSQSHPAVKPPSAAAMPSVGAVQSPQVAQLQQTTVISLKQRRPHGWPGGVAPADPAPGHIQQWLKQAREQGASDLYLSAANAPMMRAGGQLVEMGQQPVLSREQLAGLVRQMLSREQWEYVEHRGELCAGYAFAGGGRHRISVSKQINGYEISARLIPEALPPLSQLGLTDCVTRLTQFREGLVVFAGAGNSGKTTTMFAVAEAISQDRGCHMLTFEDPIEYEIKSANSLVSQREIGLHTLDYETALHSALKEDPDIVVIGEISSHKNLLCALALAEAGHLVLSSVQAVDCARTIDRLLDCPSEPQQLRNMLADSVRAIFSQQLIPRADGQGRVAACELLINSVSVANIIREAKTQSLVNVMQSGKSQGMIMMDESLRALVEEGVISGEEAYARCKNKPGFKQYLVEAEEPQ